MIKVEKKISFQHDENYKENYSKGILKKKSSFYICRRKLKYLTKGGAIGQIIVCITHQKLHSILKVMGQQSGA